VTGRAGGTVTEPSGLLRPGWDLNSTSAINLAGTKTELIRAA